MLASSDSIPIHIVPTTADYLEGIFQVQGLLRYENQALVLEYRTASLEHLDLTNAQKGVIKTYTILLRDVRSLEFKSSIFGSRLLIEVNRLNVLDGLPGVEHNRLKLRVPYKARHDADRFTAFVLAELTEIKLGDL